MSIKCSLLGHRFGETEVQRDREEEGTEVVITITELETCTRCGKTRVVSENKEVTTMETPDDGGTPLDGDTDPAAETDSDDTDTDTDPDEAADDTDSAVAETAETDVDDTGADVDGTAETDADTADDAVIIDDSADEASAQAEARTSQTTVPDADEEPTPDTADGAVIIDAESDSPVDADAADDQAEASDVGSAADEAADGDPDAAEGDREPGEWPEEPTDPAERAGETAEVEILGGGDSGDSDSDPDSGEPDPGETAEATVAGAVGEADGLDAEWPQDDGGSGGAEIAEWPEETRRDEPAEPAVSGPSLDGDDAPDVEVPEGTFKCPECGFTTDADATSLRAGDFCPECHRGTLLSPTDGSGE